MNLHNIFKKAEQLRFAVILLAAGLLISIISGIILLAPDGDYAKVDAVISSIEQLNEGDDAEYSVTVTYTVDGKEYKSELGAYDSSWSEGDTIECEYNLNNHAVIRLNSGKLMAGILCAAGIVAVIIGTVQLVKGIKKPAESYSQYNRIDEQAVDPALADEVRSNNEPMNDYVFHFTGKLNQSYIMKDKFGTPVYEGVCEGVKLVKDTPFTFRNLRTGASSEKLIGHTVTKSIGHGEFSFSTTISSAFNIDGENNWDYLAERGYGFDFSLRGLICCFDVKHHGVSIGHIETAGSEVMNEKYENNPLGKIPTNGIYRIRCQESEIEAMFMICFCITKTELTVE